MAAIAACREKKNYLGFVPNTFSQTVLHEMVLLRVLIDMVLGSIVTLSVLKANQFWAVQSVLLLKTHSFALWPLKKVCFVT